MIEGGLLVTDYMDIVTIIKKKKKHTSEKNLHWSEMSVCRQYNPISMNNSYTLFNNELSYKGELFVLILLARI